MDVKEIIEQVSEMKKSIELLKERVEQVGKLINDYMEASPAKDTEPTTWKPESLERFYYVDRDSKVRETAYHQTDPCVVNIVECGNYFKSEKRAESVAKKVRMLYKLEQYHDMFCPDFVPDWDDDSENKWSVCYSHRNHRWEFLRWDTSETRCNVYFDSEKTVQKVCDLFNSELKILKG